MKDDTTSSGTLVSALISGQFTDADAGALSGIAVIAVDNTNGAWQYTTDGGTNWLAFGTPSTNPSRLLAADALTRVRFVPNANFNGTVAGLTFRAWDQTTGTAGGTANTSLTGGTRAYSSASAIASVTVAAVNDGPTNTVPGSQTVSEDGTLVFSAGNGNLISIADIDAASGSVQVTLTATNGTVTLSGLTGLTFTGGDGTADATMTFSGTITNINAALAGMSFFPTTNYNGSGAALQIVTNDLGNTGRRIAHRHRFGFDHRQCGKRRADSERQQQSHRDQRGRDQQHRNARVRPAVGHGERGRRVAVIRHRRHGGGQYEWRVAVHDRRRIELERVRLAQRGRFAVAHG
jgi:Tfp pilus assembly protein FimT